MGNKVICKKLKKMKFNNLFKQLDLIILNFCSPIKYSLHVAGAVRICHGERIILNESDEFLTQEGLPKSKEDYEDLETNGFINDPNSLLAENMKKVNVLLQGKSVKKVRQSKWNDLVICFDDGIQIQIMPDCLGCDFEYYRFIEFLPYFDDIEKYTSTHYVVYNDHGLPKLEVERE